jgi:hypothetical protein
MRCAICGITVETIDEAVEEGWTPCFFDGDQEHEVACPSCTETLLQVGKDGEMELKEEYRGKLKYLDDGREKSSEDHLQIGIAVLENEPGNLN